MPASSARVRASSAASSSLYIRKRLPVPKARMETRAPVLPRTRVGSAVLPGSAASVPAAMPAAAVVSRNLRRVMDILELHLELHAQAKLHDARCFCFRDCAGVGLIKIDGRQVEIRVVC